MRQKLKNELKEIRLLLRAVPTHIFALFVISVFSMNLLANKSINFNVEWMALDTGIIVSWFAFLTMDIITKHFGAKAGTQISLIAMAINLLFCLLFFFGSLIVGTWGESFIDGSQDIINNALNNTFGGTWYVLLGSTVAFIVSAVVNNFSNWGFGLLFKKKPDSFLAFAVRSYVSTAIGQFLDNLTFALIVSHFFFGWTILQCFVCSAVGMVAELLCEIIFSPIGYKACKRLKKEGIGQEYFAFRNERKKQTNAGSVNNADASGTLGNGKTPSENDTQTANGVEE